MPAKVSEPEPALVKPPTVRPPKPLAHVSVLVVTSTFPAAEGNRIERVERSPAKPGWSRSVPPTKLRTPVEPPILSRLLIWRTPSLTVVVLLPPPAVLMPESTRVPRPDLVRSASVPSGADTSAVRRGVKADDPGFITWKTYSVVPTERVIPPPKPLRAIRLSEPAVAAGSRVKSKAPLPRLSFAVASPVTVKSPVVARPPTRLVEL